MQNAFIFIVGALFDLYVITFFFRLVLGWSRADFRNPLAQFVVKVTNPLVVPARRFIPPIGKLDLATLVVLIVLQSLATWVLMRMACVGDPEALQVIGTGLLQLAAPDPAHLEPAAADLRHLQLGRPGRLQPGDGNARRAGRAGARRLSAASFRRSAGSTCRPCSRCCSSSFVIMLIPGAVAMNGVVCAPF